MAWTQADVDALKASIATGILTVMYEGPPKRLITYQSLHSMRELLAEMIGQVNDAAGTRQSFRLAGTRKGV